MSDSRRCSQIAISVALLFTLGCSERVSDAELLKEARLASANRDYSSAERVSLRVPRSSALRVAALLIAGEAATKAEKYSAALKYYDEAAGDLSTTDRQLAAFSAAEIYLEQGRLQEAERRYRLVLKQQPDNGATNWRMAFLLSITNRRWEAVHYYSQLTKGGRADYRELGMAADVDRQIRQPDFLDKCQSRNPDGPLVRLALATEAFREGHPNAETKIRAAIRESSYRLTAELMLGELLLKRNDETGFLNWMTSLPSEANEFPDLWYLRGLWARDRGELDVSADCLEQAIARAPQHRRAFTALAQVLEAENSPNAGEVADYANALAEISQQVDRVLTSEGRNQRAIRATAELMERVGRVWDACAWAVIARDLNPTENWHRELLARLGPRLTADLPTVASTALPLHSSIQNQVPRLDEMIAEAQQSQPKNDSTIANVTPSAIRFSHRPFPDFRYENGGNVAKVGVRQFEETGGGVAVIDLDLDLHPDIFLPQGLHWVSGDLEPMPSEDLVDTVLRNNRGLKFDVITATALGHDFVDDGFGQGCSAADIDNDGFQDLYVANTHRNRLYQNMGDGTFADITEESGIAGEHWTVSTLICDLTGDGLPDILDVNYLEGDDVYTKVCGERACSPSAFEGSCDRLHINLGDRRFLTQPEFTPNADAKGLGVVAFPISGSHAYTVFVANDQVANHCLQIFNSEDSPHSVEIVETAFTTGLAFNDHGLPLACMGVVAEDFNGDGSLDLFVTNFQDESNTMYLQDAPGLFVDGTRALNLYAASLPFTSWGTQTIDADLDGLPDLVVGNGHVDDAREFGGDYFQRPQFFHNQGRQFEELKADSIGPWFKGEYLCRGLAKLDWNSDGRMDFAVSRIGDSASLLTNNSESGHFVNVIPIGVDRDRDSFCTKITVAIDGREITKCVTAGDGYMASNQSLIQFGLGPSDQIDSIRITWPDGSTQQVSTPEADSTYLVAEDRSRGTCVRNGNLSSVAVLVRGSEP